MARHRDTVLVDTNVILEAHRTGSWRALTEPYRVFRRLQTLKDWSHETFKQILPGAAGRAGGCSCSRGSGASGHWQAQRGSRSPSRSPTATGLANRAKPLELRRSQLSFYTNRLYPLQDATSTLENRVPTLTCMLGLGRGRCVSLLTPRSPCGDGLGIDGCVQIEPKSCSFSLAPSPNPYMKRPLHA